MISIHISNLEIYTYRHVQTLTSSTLFIHIHIFAFVIIFRINTFGISFELDRMMVFACSSSMIHI